MIKFNLYSINRIIFILLALGLSFYSQKSYSQNSKDKSKKEPKSSSKFGQSWNRFSVNLGGFLGNYNSGITLGSSTLGLGLVLNIEEVVGFKTSSLVFRGSVNYKIGKTKRNTLTFDYFSINRAASKILDEELDFGGIIYPVGSEISSRYDLTILRAKYDYAIFQDDRVSVGVSLGFFIMPVKLAIKANGIVDSNTRFTAPLPLLGLRTDFKITKKLYLKQSAEILYISIQNFSGSLLDLNIALEYNAFKHFGLGLGVNSNRINVKVKQQISNINFSGDVRVDYTGLLFYAKFYF